MKPCKNQGAYLRFADPPWMMTNNCAFNVISILINLVSEALRNKIGTNNKLLSDDIDMLANSVKISLSIPPNLLYFPFLPANI